MGLKLKADPTFKVAVRIPLPGGLESEPVDFVFKHRTRKEFSEFAEWCNGKSDAECTMAMLDGWSLDDEFGRDNVERLLENYHGAAEAISNAYGEHLTQRRLGNFGPLRPRS